MQNKFRIIDESGDRKYFTIIPNYIVNHSTIYEQAIYLYMKRVAGEGGTCWSSAQEIANKLGCSRNTVRKYREKLVKRGWIEPIGIKKTGATNQSIPEYKIIDLWDLNNSYYAKKNKMSINDILPERCHQATPKVSSVAPKEDPIKEKPINMRSATPSAHNIFIKFFFDTCKSKRGVKPIITGKDGNNLKRILKLNIISESDLEKIAYYFLAAPSFKKFSPSISTFLSAGILNGLMNDLKNDNRFWKNMDSLFGTNIELSDKIAKLTSKLST